MNEQETTTDIIAWLRRPREGENGYLTAWRDEIADRLEAAHKRELHELRAENEYLKQERNQSGVRERRRLEANGFAIVPKDKLEAVGNSAAIREALKHIKDRLPHMLQYMRVHWEDASSGGYFDELMLVIDAALAAPPRNCDVGTASEQEDRFAKYCRGSNYCAVCPIRKSWDFKNGRRPSCAILWAQGPHFEEGGAKC